MIMHDRRKRQVAEGGSQHRDSQISPHAGGQDVEPGITDQQNARRERGERYKLATPPAQHRGHGHERNEQTVEAHPRSRPVLGNIVRGQAEAEVDDPWNQRDRAAHHQGQPGPPHATRDRWWNHFVKRTLQPMNQVAAFIGRHRCDAGIRQHTMAMASHDS